MLSPERGLTLQVPNRLIEAGTTWREAGLLGKISSRGKMLFLFDSVFHPSQIPPSPRTSLSVFLFWVKGRMRMDNICLVERTFLQALAPLNIMVVGTLDATGAGSINLPCPLPATVSDTHLHAHKHHNHPSNCWFGNTRNLFLNNVLWGSSWKYWSSKRHERLMNFNPYGLLMRLEYLLINLFNILKPVSHHG